MPSKRRCSEESAFEAAKESAGPRQPMSKIFRGDSSSATRRGAKVSAFAPVQGERRKRQSDNVVSTRSDTVSRWLPKGEPERQREEGEGVGGQQGAEDMAEDVTLAKGQRLGDPASCLLSKRPRHEPRLLRKGGRGSTPSRALATGTSPRRTNDGRLL